VTDATPAGHARFLVVLDVDSTLIQDEVIELIADRIGVRDEVADITERAMRGELDFSGSLRERVKLLAGVPVDELEAVRDAVRLSIGAQELVDGVHAAGGRVAVVSGGSHEVLDGIAEGLGLDRWRANRLGVTPDGKLSGDVDGEIVDKDTKRRMLESWADEFGVPLNRTVAIGDGANDLEMMAGAGCSIAFNAKPVVKENASIVAGERDLSQVLSVLGLRG